MPQYSDRRQDPAAVKHCDKCFRITGLTSGGQLLPLSEMLPVMNGELIVI